MHYRIPVMSELPLVDPAAPPSLAEQALANLVNQFARPLDFLRELAQNSIDAGSPRIEVAVAFDPPAEGADEGVLRIHVDDFGEGMDEEIIDNQLTRLFSSSKEDDLTKIGKFGIGFTSIFAIRPEAVLLRTGRHGEYWELLFHADRSFDKVRIEEPVQGTRITLFKRMSAERVAAFVQEVRFVLDYWCEHSDTPITFDDRTDAELTPPSPGDDPFARFADVTSDTAARINRPLVLDAAIQHAETHDGIEVVVGCAKPARFGFYNGGLTLLNTQNLDVLGEYRDHLGHLSFKVKHDGLEHTLTRDNVLHDHNWDRAMHAVLRARMGLRTKLLERAVQAAAEGEPLGTWHARLAAECRADANGVPPARPGSSATAAPYRTHPRRFFDSLEPANLFRDIQGQPCSLARIRKHEGRVGGVLVAEQQGPLTEALIQSGHLLIEDNPHTRTLLHALDEPAPVFEFLGRRREIRAADQVFVLPALVEPAELEPMERRLLERTEELLRYAVGVRFHMPMRERPLQWTPGKGSVTNRLSIRVGDFGGMDLGRRDVLALNGPTDGRVFLRPEPSWFFRLPAFLTWRTLLVNRQHPLFRAQLLASAEDMDVAAFGLASALLHTEGIEGDGAHARMIATLTDELPALPGPTAGDSA